MVPIWYWFVSAVILLWNAVGCAACYTQMAATPEKIAKLPEAQRDAWLAMPMAPKIAYAIAVGAGLFGSLALLFRDTTAGPLFIASLAGVIIQFGWFFLVYRGASRLGASSAAFPGFIALVAIGQIAFACAAKSHGWLT